MPVHIYRLVVALEMQVVAPGGRRKTDKEGRREKGGEKQERRGKKGGKGGEDLTATCMYVCTYTVHVPYNQPSLKLPHVLDTRLTTQRKYTCSAILLLS